MSNISEIILGYLNKVLLIVVAYVSCFKVISLVCGELQVQIRCEVLQIYSNQTQRETGIEFRVDDIWIGRAVLSSNIMTVSYIDPFLN